MASGYNHSGGISGRVGSEQAGEESSESDGEAEPDKSFRRRLSTSGEIKRAAATKEGFLMKETWSFQRWRRRYFRVRKDNRYHGKGTKVRRSS
ncbi:Diacylglycerol kinase eta [Zootermopsis nevadensis]|uniref:Diacylglycerol kinase eta n=1 Tax=Zootermopsis nevadensis TaxID=136037 RepID=A0A067R8S3_ZOONE|nr:Diacylglycerol kinase eta [Zootermopsis nevadensis]